MQDSRKLIVVRPLDTSNKPGHHDEKGRFCQPLSHGYHIVFPVGDQTTFDLKFFNHWIGSATKIGDIHKMAQDDHAFRVRSSVAISQTSLNQVIEEKIAEELAILRKIAQAATELATVVSDNDERELDGRKNVIREHSEAMISLLRELGSKDALAGPSSR